MGHGLKPKVTCIVKHPPEPITGQIRINDWTNEVEVYNGTDWVIDTPLTVQHQKDILWKEVHKIEKEKGRYWQDPTPEMLKDPMFDAIWNVLRTWDISVPEAYDGYCGATGNHVRAILDAVNKVKK